MKLKRLWWTVRIGLTMNGIKRVEYVRKKGIYNSIGANVYIQPRIVPLYSELIRFHNNIVIAKNVDFCTHDIMHAVFNRINIPDIENYKFSERIGCIEIMDNVFVGSNSVILYNTKIGPNVIIASGSVVVKDCEPNSVYAGIPARKVGTFDDFIHKRISKENNAWIATTRHNQALTAEDINNAWKVFDEIHSL